MEQVVRRLTGLNLVVRVFHNRIPPTKMFNLMFKVEIKLKIHLTFHLKFNLKFSLIFFIRNQSSKFQA